MNQKRSVPSFASDSYREMPHSPDKIFHALGSVTWLLQYSELHQKYPVNLLLSRILPPMEFDQFKMFYNSNKFPIGFCAWARLSKERYEEITQGKRQMEHEDWQSGDIPFIAELVAPFGHMVRIARMLKQDVFKGELVTSLKINRNFTGQEGQKPFRVQKFQA